MKLKRNDLQMGTKVQTKADAEVPGATGEVVELTATGYRIRWSDGQVEFGLWSELGWAAMSVVQEAA